MILNKEKIADGIFLSAINTDKFKASVLSFSITVPLCTKSLAYNLILSGLLRRGTKKYPSMAHLNRSLDELYGSYVEIRSSHIGDNISLTIGAEILDNRYIPDGTNTLGGVIDIMSDILLHPLLADANFDEEVFRQECKIVKESLDAEVNNTRSYSIRRCVELVRGNEYPTLEQIKETVGSATLPDILDYYKQLISSAPLDVFYVGATPYEEICKNLINALTEYPYQLNSRQLIPITAASFKETKSKTEKMPVSQGKLAMAFNTGVCVSPDDEKYYTVILLNEILGGSAASKLFLNVREKMGLCYHCSSSYSIYTGIIMASSGFEVNNFETVKDAILQQLEEIKFGNVSSHELEAAKKSLFNSYRQLYDNPFDLQAFYSGRALFGIDDTIEDCLCKISRITAEQISNSAKQISLDSVFFVEGTVSGYTEEVDENE